MKKLSLILLLLTFTIAACDSSGEEVAQVPTATLQPLVTLTPLPTATPFITRTPLPTYTFTPTVSLTPSNTPVPPSPTPTPPITGVVGGGQLMNFRDAPNQDAEIIGALTPGDGLLILGQNREGTWLNVRTDDGTEGWVWGQAIYIVPTSTPPASATPTQDRTAIALGTTFPTAVIGGGTITPTPPRAAVTATPVGTGSASVSNPDTTETPTAPFLPIIDVDAINQTATALAGGIVQISSPTPNPAGAATQAQAQITLPATTTGQAGATALPDANATNTPVAPPISGEPRVRQNVQVFALCDDPNAGGPAAPSDLAVGSSITIWWSWIMSDASFLAQHEAAVDYEIRLNGERLTGWRNYGGELRQTGSSYAKSWFLPAGTLTEPGTYQITYRASWSEQISDGFATYGPGTNNFIEEGSCTFQVR